jgi:hypothetical protein
MVVCLDFGESSEDIIGREGRIAKGSALECDDISDDAGGVSRVQVLSCSGYVDRLAYAKILVHILPISIVVTHSLETDDLGRHTRRLFNVARTRDVLVVTDISSIRLRPTARQAY